VASSEENESKRRPALGRKLKPVEERTPRLSREVLAGASRGPRASTGPVGGHPNRGHAALDVQAPSPSARRVAIKVHVVPIRGQCAPAAQPQRPAGEGSAANAPPAGGGNRQLRAHLDYIERDGVEQDGSKGVLYGPGLGAEDVRAAFAEPLPGERHQFRLIVSPEDAHELDLRSFTSGLMARMERDLGRQLRWVAVNHYNTDSPHTHVVIRGVDWAGAELRIDRQYISNGMRWRAQALATAELGLRSKLDVQRQLATEVSRERWTSLDRQLERLAVAGLVRLGGVGEGAEKRLNRQRLIGRLTVLQRMGLATATPGGTWAFRDGWTKTLRELGERGDVIKTMHRALRGDHSRYRVFEPAAEQGRVVQGVVREKKLHDELKGLFAVVMETSGGEGLYVRVPAGVAERVRIGQVVSLTAKPTSHVKDVDRELAAVASASGGLHTEAAARAHLAGKTRDLEGALELHRARLDALARLALVERLGPSSYRVSADLLERLAAKDRLKPLSRIELRAEGPLTVADQRLHRGPTWLDRVEPGVSRAPHGFGAEVSKALQTRTSFLKSIGIDPSEGGFVRELRKIEAKELGERLAKEQSTEFVPAIRGSQAWKGTVMLVTAGSGRRYAQVESEGRFVLLPASSELRALQGKRAVVRWENKKLVVRQDGLERGVE
jgi:type IV secretory pathway VirD2 relaxase